MVEYSDLDAVLAALADPTRRAILARLSDGAARVTELAAPFPMSLNSVSKHIRTLERAELVRREKRGREHILTLNAEPLVSAARWMDEQAALWTWRLGALETILKEPADDRSS
jgi:DNA-binding transcriptional ArsR family regulator